MVNVIAGIITIGLLCKIWDWYTSNLRAYPTNQPLIFGSARFHHVVAAILLVLLLFSSAVLFALWPWLGLLPVVSLVPLWYAHKVVLAWRVERFVTRVANAYAEERVAGKPVEDAKTSALKRVGCTPMTEGESLLLQINIYLQVKGMLLGLKDLEMDEYQKQMRQLEAILSRHLGKHGLLAESGV
jgi:hypothetical protein